MTNGKDINFDNFRDNLSMLIKTHGMSQRAFAIDADISVPTISRYLSGERTPDLIYIIQIAEYFNVSIDWLLGRSDSTESLPTDVKDVVKKYVIASESDKLVIRTILEKYEKDLYQNM